MKKLIVLIAVLAAALFIVGCASTGPSASDKVSDAKSGAPAGALIASGTASEGSKEASEKKAKDRAMFAIVKGLTFIAGELVDDAVSAGKLASADGTELRQNISTALSRSALNRIVKVDSGVVGKNEAWCVYYLEKSDALKEIDQAVASAKEKVSARNFNTDGFDAKFRAAAARDWK